MLERIAVKQAADYFKSYPDGTEFNIDVYYTILCTARVKTVLKLDNTQQVACCDHGMSAAQYVYNHYDGQETHKCFNVYEEIVCGDKCCYKSYLFEVFSYRDMNQQWHKSTRILNVNTYQETTCGGDSDYEDCLTGSPVPCQEADCEQD